MIGTDLLIIGIMGCIFIPDIPVLFESFITLGITLLSVATISYLFESEGWVKHLKNTLSDLMTDPKFLLESFNAQGIRDKCKKILKGGLKIDILGDEFFDAVDNNYINPLLGPIYENFHMIINFEFKKIHNTDVISVTSRRSFLAYNPTEDKLNLFPDNKLVWSRYYINKKYKNYIKNVKNKKIVPYTLKSLKFDDCECLNDYVSELNESFDNINNSHTSILKCNKQLLPYKMSNTMTNIDYEEEYTYPFMDDYAFWTFKTIVKDITILINYPYKKLNISAYITKHAPDNQGHFAKKLSGRLGGVAIISNEIFFPGTVLFMHWSPK